MPQVSSADQATLRTSPHQSKVGLFVFRPLIIATGDVVAQSVGQGVNSISLDNFSSTETPQEHFTVIAGSTPNDDDGGKTRLKSISGSQIELAYNNIEWNTYPYVSILRVIEPWTVLPDQANQFMDRNKAYTNQNLLYHPLARIGPPAFGYVNEPVKFYSNSEAIATGASLSSHSWSFPSGSPSTSTLAGSAGSPIEVTWPAVTGHVPHYMTYTVTDNNGVSHKRYNPVWIIDEFCNSISDFEIESCDGDYDAGTWRCRLRIFEQATTTEFPQDAMIMLVAEDRYAGHKTSIGGNWDHREEIVFVGWIVNGSVFRDDEDGSVTFEAIGPVGKMSALTDWPANLEYRVSPTTWDHLEGMTSDRSAFHIITERSTFDHICDINLTNNTKLLRYVDIPESDLRNQLDNYCLSPIGAKVLSDRQGQIYFSRNPNLRPLNERTSITVTMEVLLDDIRAEPGLELSDEKMEKEVCQIDFIGFTYNGLDVTPIYSLAPQFQFEEGRVEKVDGIRVDSQTEANVLSGMYLAERNNIWREVKLPTFNYRVFDIAPEHYTTLSLTATDTRRGVVWNSQKLLCRSVSVVFDREKETIMINPSFEKDSFGPPGIGGGYPTEQPTSESNPTPQPRPPGDSIALWASLFTRYTNESDWTQRSELHPFTDGCVDPWWWTRYKANSLDPERAYMYGVKDSNIYVSRDGGTTFNTVTVATDPANDWSDSPAPTVDDLSFIWIEGDIFQDGRFYALAQYQNASNEYRGYVLVTDDDFATSTWYTLYNGTSLPAEVRPLGLAVGEIRFLITVWTSDNELVCQVWAPDILTLVRNDQLGSAMSSDIDDKTCIAYPATVEDNGDTWYIYGRMKTPPVVSGAADPEHIIKTVDRGAVYTSFKSSYGVNYVQSLIVGLSSSGDDLNRKHYAAIGPAS